MADDETNMTARQLSKLLGPNFNNFSEKQLEAQRAHAEWMREFLQTQQSSLMEAMSSVTQKNAEQLAESG